MRKINIFYLIIPFVLILIMSTQNKVFCDISDDDSNSKSNTLFNSQVNNHFSIDSIWTVDYRPEPCEVQLFWIGPATNSKVKCRIQKWEFNEEEPVSFYTIIDSLQPDQLNRYSYIDRDVKEGMYYRYKVWMKQDSVQWISSEAYTVPQPVIGKWGDWPPNPTLSDIVYINGETDIVEIESIEFDYPKYWRADFLKFKVTHNEITIDESHWQSADLLSFLFNLQDPLGDLTQYDGQTFCFYTQTKDSLGNTSQWSSERKTILDVSGPEEVQRFAIIPEVNNDATDGWMKIEWSQANDALSGISHYNLSRRKGIVGDFEPIPNAQNLTDTTFSDLYSDIDTSTTIFYLLEAIDYVGNKSIVGKDGARCLLGPKILLIADKVINGNKYVLADSVSIDCPNFDISGLVGFNLKLNNEIIPTVETDTMPFIIYGISQFPSDTLFIQVQALFENIQNPLTTTWSNIDSIIRVTHPPEPVSDLSVTNILPEWAKDQYNKWEGNLYLHWTKPSEQIVRYEIWRLDDTGDTTLVDTLSSTSNSLTLVDRYDFDEYNDVPGDTLFVFQYYTYGVKAFNFLGDSSEISNLDSDYCNRAPENVRGKIIGGNQVMWEVSWDPLRTHLKKGEFNYIAICYYHPLQGNKKIHQILTSETTVAKFKVNTDKMYSCEVHAVELLSGRKDSTEKSIPIFCDFREPPFPHVKMNELELQPQPYQAGIFVCWEKYWQNDFWDDNYLTLVDLFQLTRYEMSGNTKIDSLIIDFPKNTEEWQKARFMDDSLLVANMNYKYRVDPCLINDDGDTLKPRFFFEKGTKHDTTRVFIPKIDSIYAKGKFNSKLFFNGNENKITVKWYYLKEDGITKDTTSRGAATIKIQLSIDTTAYPHSVAKIITPAYQSDTLVTSVEFTNIDTLEHYSNTPYFIEISAFDKWGNKHGYTTKYEDGDFMIYDDSKPPTKSYFTSIISRADTSSEIGKIQLRLTWEEGFEDTLTESGIRCYNIDLYDINNDEKKETWQIFNSTDTTLIMGFPDLKNENLLDYGRYFKIIPEDLVGNCAEPDSEEWYPIPHPQLIEVSMLDTITCKIRWSPVTYLEGYSIDSYYIEWCNNIYLLGDDNIRDEPHSIVVPGNQTMKEIRHHRFQFKLYFHIHARVLGKNNQIQESGWSNIKTNKSSLFLLEELTEIDDGSEQSIPLFFNLKQNYPNPFNSATQIEYCVPRHCNVKMRVFNILGEEIINLLNEEKAPGIYNQNWDAKDNNNQIVSSGVYLIVFEAGSFKKIIRCIYFK